MKPGTAKTKGRAVENQAVEWLRSKGWVNAERRRLNGTADMGDVTGIPGMCIEVKSAAQWTPVQWIRELVVEQANAQADVGFVLARPKGGTNVDDWVVMMTPAQLLELLDAAGWTATDAVTPRD